MLVNGLEELGIKFIKPYHDIKYIYAHNNRKLLWTYHEFSCLSSWLIGGVKNYAFMNIAHSK